MHFFVFSKVDRTYSCTTNQSQRYHNPPPHTRKISFCKNHRVYVVILSPCVTDKFTHVHEHTSHMYMAEHPSALYVWFVFVYVHFIRRENLMWIVEKKASIWASKSSASIRDWLNYLIEVATTTSTVFRYAERNFPRSEGLPKVQIFTLELPRCLTADLGNYQGAMALYITTKWCCVFENSHL